LRVTACPRVAARGRPARCAYPLPWMGTSSYPTGISNGEDQT
jgi:hypothetical protein